MINRRIMRPRYLQKIIPEDALAMGKMAFVTGPRQVGKSTLARTFLSAPSNYFLYDDEEFRRAWGRSAARAIEKRGPGPIVLDEIHKDRRWKSRLKGIFDRHTHSISLVVTGSARFDVFRKGSDSLLGRYIPYRLHPFSVSESETPPSPQEILEVSQVSYAWDDLMRLGGFPEPLLGAHEARAKRWSRLRLDRLVREDTRDFRAINDSQAFILMADLLPERVGSLLSVNALREDLNKAYATVRAWLKVLDILYFSFTVKPFSRHLRRANRADPKLYLYDVLRIPPRMMAKRLENLCALHLLKACHYWTDTAHGEFELAFIRTKDGREVDFVILESGRPWLLLECKSGNTTPSRDLVHFAERLKPRHTIQLTTQPDTDRSYPALAGARVLSYERFFAGWV